MRFAYKAHPVSKDDNVEHVRLSVWNYYEPGSPSPVSLEWSRGQKTDWSNPNVPGLDASNLGSLDVHTSLILSLVRFVQKNNLNTIEDPSALIDLFEKNNAVLFVETASGDLIKAAELAMKSETDEFMTDCGDMKQRLSTRATDELSARKILQKALVDAAEDHEKPDNIENLSAWMRAGRPVKKINKREQSKLPDLAVYCKRGTTRTPTLTIKKADTAKTK